MDNCDLHAPPPTRSLGLGWFSLLATVVGAVAGLGAVAFRALIAIFHNLLFFGNWSTVFDANQHTAASPWGAGIILVPVLGAAGVAYLVKTYAPEARGHGVPEVIDAIYYNRGRIRPTVAVIKSLASALSIGSGGSVGREGPIIQIGSSFGSTVGQILRVSAWQRITLIAGGAGAGIAATFNTPVGGVLFALEMMMHEVSARTLVPVAIATATGTYVGRLWFGTHPSFVIPALETPYFHTTNPLILLAFVGLGMLMGGVSALFIKSVYATEHFFERRVGGGYYRQHLCGMFVVGLIMYGLLRTTGHYHVEGVGYATVQDILSGTPATLLLLVALGVLKLLATSLTLGSGASGGIFSPALFLGATLGGAYGTVLQHFFPALGVSAPAFAVAGMAGVVGGATGAAMAAIVMIFEMTLDYNVIVPMTITVAISYGIRKLLSWESIYTMKLAQRGHRAPDALHAGLHQVQRAGRFMQTNVACVAGSCPAAEFLRLLDGSASIPEFFITVENHQATGFLRYDTLADPVHRGLDNQKISGQAKHNFATVDDQATFYDVVHRLRAGHADLAIVLGREEPGRNKEILGVITREQLGDAVIENSRTLED